MGVYCSRAAPASFTGCFVWHLTPPKVCLSRRECTILWGNAQEPLCACVHPCAGTIIYISALYIVTCTVDIHCSYVQYMPALCMSLLIFFNQQVQEINGKLARLHSTADEMLQRLSVIHLHIISVCLSLSYLYRNCIKKCNNNVFSCISFRITPAMIRWVAVAVNNILHKTVHVFKGTAQSSNRTFSLITPSTRLALKQEFHVQLVEAHE